MAPPRRYRKQAREVGIYGIQNTVTGKWPEATKAARVEAMRGRTPTPERCKQISVDKKAQWADPAQREKMMTAQRVPKSAEGAANIAAASLKRLRDTSPEQVEARRQSLLKAWETRRAKKPQVTQAEATLG